MHGKFKMRALLLAMLLGLGAGNVRATTFLQFQSTYLGDGWFQYQMRVMPDPFFTEQDVTQFVIGFTNQTDWVSGTNSWSCTESTNGASTWAFTNGIPVPPYTETFLMRSTETSYRLASFTNHDAQAPLVLVSLMLADYAPPIGGGGSVYSVNVVGYAWMSGLIPCRLEEADGSPTNFVYTLKLLPDVEIKQLVQDGNNNVTGVDFLWDSESTFVLQGTSDLVSWTNIAYLWSYPPETVWTTNRSLGDFGNFFRLALVATGHATTLPPLNAATQPAPLLVKAKASTPAPTTPRVTGFNISHGTIEVNVATQAGQAAQVQAVDRKGTVLQTRRIQPKGTSATVTFGASSLPGMVFFRASPL